MASWLATHADWSFVELEWSAVHREPRRVLWQYRGLDLLYVAGQLAVTPTCERAIPKGWAPSDRLDITRKEPVYTHDGEVARDANGREIRDHPPFWRPLASPTTMDVNAGVWTIYENIATPSARTLAEWYVDTYGVFHDPRP